jgi:DNA replicative helicase MCM subunit Mcm2 (Cdc46/Mcm family)
MDGEEAEKRVELKQQFSAFLDQDSGLGEYADKIKALLTKDNVQKNKLRLEVDVHDLRHFDAGLFTSLLTDPTECIQPFEDALEGLVNMLNDDPKNPKVMIRCRKRSGGFCAALF